MKTLTEIGLIGALLTVLSGCGIDGPAADTEAEAGTAAGGVEAIFVAERDGDPAIVVDADALGAEIDRRFGDENAASISLEEGDSIADIYHRAGSE